MVQSCGSALITTVWVSITAAPGQLAAVTGTRVLAESCIVRRRQALRAVRSRAGSRERNRKDRAQRERGHKNLRATGHATRPHA